MAERVNTRTEALARQVRRMPTAGWLVLLVAGAVITAIIVSVTVTSKGPKITTQLLALPSGADASHFLVRYQIVKPSHTDVTCTVQAVGKDHDIVGSMTDTIPANTGTKRTSTRDVSVPTTELAVSANIVNCAVVAER